MMNLKSVLYCVALLTVSPSVSSGQSTFVEFHKEVTSFDNSECIQKDYDVSYPLFDADSLPVISQLNDTLYKIARLVLDDVNSSLIQKPKSWKEDRQAVNRCEDGVAMQETRELIYSILLNTDDVLSFLLRHHWLVEKFEQGAALPEMAGQERVYCFTVDLKQNRITGVNDLFLRDSVPSLINHIREAYETEYDEIMDKAGDRLVFAGFLFNDINLIALYERLLPGNQSETRLVEIPLNEVADLMQARYRQLLSSDNE
jgi:hypothetical protein